MFWSFVPVAVLTVALFVPPTGLSDIGLCVFVMLAV